jgi:hypothetical protein
MFSWHFVETFPHKTSCTSALDVCRCAPLPQDGPSFDVTPYYSGGGGWWGSGRLVEFLISCLARAGIHERFGVRKKTGSELIFPPIYFKIRFYSISNYALLKECQCCCDEEKGWARLRTLIIERGNISVCLSQPAGRGRLVCLDSGCSDPSRLDPSYYIPSMLRPKITRPKITRPLNAPSTFYPCTFRPQTFRPNLRSMSPCWSF